MLFLLIFLYSGVAQAELNKQQALFLESYSALKKGERVISTSLKDYILNPYLEYLAIQQNIRTTSDKTLEKFINQNGNSYLAEKLWTILLGRMATRKQWQTIIDYYKEGTGSLAAKCYFLQAHIELSLENKKNETLDEHLIKAKELWLSPNYRPNTCKNLFSLLKQKGRINQDAYWQRISLAMEKGNTRLVRSLINALKKENKDKVKLWLKLRKNPEKFLNDGLIHPNNLHNDKDDAYNREIIIYGIKRLARKKTSKAKTLWAKTKNKHNFTSKEKANVQSYFGVRDALDHSPYALRKLSSISQKYRSDDGNIWMARMAVRQGDWKKLLAATDAMNEEQLQKDSWRYWRAHALHKMGQKMASKKLFKALSNDASFYGFLSADRLKLPYQRLLQTPKEWQKCTSKIAQLGSIQRAVELFKIGKPRLAKKEWFWTLKHLNKEGVLAAAAYAQEINQLFLSILTVSKTKDWNQVELRFPLQYASLVKSSAKKHKIPPAWVYGVMRRESAFDPKIVSSAKAQGLMQVLPSTAKGVAKKLGIRDHKKSDLLIPEKNTNIGSAYLSGLLKKFKGNFVKATAAYNAGPGRVIKWAPDFHIDAPRWVESIPFTETRKYVRAVMSYTTIYDFKLHHKQGTNLRLSKRLKPVGPN